MAEPEVSVLMTAYNAERDIAAAVSSILSQTFRELELIVVDDGSSDGTLRVLESFKDPRLRVLRQRENKGQTASLNAGLRLARAPLVARQDADDLSHPERIQRQAVEFHRRPDLVLLGTQGVVMNPRAILTGLLSAPLGAREIRGWFAWGNPFIHTSVMFRRAAAERLGGYDERFRICQDYDMWMRMAELGEADNLPGRLVAYRVYAGSLSRSREDVTRMESETIRGRWRASGWWSLSARTRALLALSAAGAGMSPGQRALALALGAGWVLKWLRERALLAGRPAARWMADPVRG